MNKFFTTIKNIFSIEELRNRILTTLGLLLIFRLGSFVVLPGVDPDILADQLQDSGGIFDFINIFLGGAFNRASVFALGDHALHFCFDCVTIDDCGCSLFSKTTERGR